MRRSVRLRGPWALLPSAALALALLTGCLGKAPGQAPGQAQPGATRTGVSAVLPSGLRPGPDDRTLLVQVKLPAGRPDCAVDPRPQNLYETDTSISFDVVYDAVMTDDGVAVPGCGESQDATVTVTLSRPIGTRSVALASTETWTLVGREFQRCRQWVGCHPPADHCDPGWIDLVVAGLDVPLKRIRGVRDVRGCDQRWLVLDVNPAVGDCPAYTEGSPCAVPSRTRRLFLRWTAQGWQTFASARNPGCAEVRAADPAFPTGLCERLPAIT